MLLSLITIIKIFCLSLSDMLRFFKGGYATKKWQFQQLSGRMAESS